VSDSDVATFRQTLVFRVDDDPQARISDRRKRLFGSRIRAIDDYEHLHVLVSLAERVEHRPAHQSRTVASRDYRGDEMLGHCWFLINSATRGAVRF
jgi:hypothetical protein